MKVNIGRYKKANKRKVDIKIDDFDTNNLDTTLALIIYPALIQLKQNKQGGPLSMPGIVAGVDLSTEQQLTFSFYHEEMPDDWFEKQAEEWYLALDKMIWAFQQIVEASYEYKYVSVNPKISIKESGNKYLNPATGILEPTYEMINVDDEYWFDDVGYKEHERRIQEGLDLFAKYYRNLWD